MNISKSYNIQNKLKFENSLNFNSLIKILSVNLNSNLAYNLLMAFSYLTESKEIMGNIMDLSKKSEKRINSTKLNTSTITRK